MLDQIIAEKWFTPKAAIDFWSANSVGDDIRLYTDENRKTGLATFYTLRQQLSRRETQANLALADFIAPETSGKADYIGGFVVTAGSGEEVLAEYFEQANDDYSAILLKVLSDRFSEALAELMHERVRKEFWGYAGEEHFTNEELICEFYKGIRPAPGYPAQPDHTEKRTLFDLLDVSQATGVVLTENYAMWPGSSVAGFYFSHPESYYFGVAKVERDQVEDYAARKGMVVEEVERWLAPILNYLSKKRKNGD
ncbi:MAG: 5-methyltetrahydrofolate--homocysteine methyltransferase [Candidatus Tokpelaia sp. JSC189]|nr:MAG: 5-methyltetrahydrofolate--homocysteine methyltransferase [Candidatus Tokpelaia sp. JSC189]